MKLSLELSKRDTRRTLYTLTRTFTELFVRLYGRTIPAFAGMTLFFALLPLPSLFSVKPKPLKRIGGHTMSNTITLPQTILKRLEKISAGTRRTPQAIIKQTIKDRLEYEEWKLEQIDAGLADIKAGRVYSADEV